VYPPQRIFTNISKEQILELVKDVNRSMESDAAEVSLYQILEQRLATVEVRAPGEKQAPMGVDLALREKDEVIRVIRGLVQKKYDEINGKQEVVAFLKRLAAYAT
jgi:hypothetical protein